MTPTQNIYDIIPQSCRIKKLNQKPFIFLEGPVWDSKRETLFFSDVLDQKIFAINKSHVISVIYENSRHVNGMCLNDCGNLVACQMDLGRIIEIDPESKKFIKIISEGYNNLPFNATNDIIYDQINGYYVTDPFFHYGPKTQDLEATYYCNVKGDTIRVAADSIKPNGLVLSPDRKKLYIDDTGSTKVWKYDVLSNGSLGCGVVFCNINPPKNFSNLTPIQYFGEADGMEVDSCGNIYVTTVTGIQIFNSEGNYIGVINMPENESASNCVFGGKNKNILYITARTSLYFVELLIPGL